MLISADIVLTVFILWALLALVSAIAYRGRRFGPGSLLMPGRRKVVERELARLSLARLEPAKLLVIRPLGDEASGGLVTAQFLSWTVAAFLRMVEWFRAWGWTQWTRLIALFGFILLIVAGANLLGVIPEEAAMRLEGAGDLMAAALGLFPLVGIVLGAAALLGVGLLLLLAALPFGLDAMIFSLFAATTAEPSPSGSSNVLQVGVTGDSGMVHSQIYDDDSVIDAIVRWMTEK